MRSFRKHYIEKNRSNKAFNPIGVVLHETATQGATAKNERSYFNNNEVKASAHGFIDWNEDVQTIPWNEKAWHAKEPANSMFIGIEMCRPLNDDNDKIAKMQEVYVASVEAVARLFKYVLKINKVTKDNLMSHDEVRIKWKKTTHVDPTSYLFEIDKTMNVFRKDVQLALDKLNGK